MDTVYKRLYTRGNFGKSAVYELGEKLFMEWVKSWGYPLNGIRGWGSGARGVNNRAQVCTPRRYRLRTFFTQALPIETLPYTVYLLPDDEVEFYGFFYLFNGVDSSGMVFATQLASNFRETEM